MALYVVIIIDDASYFEFNAKLTPRIALLKSKSTEFTNFYTHPVCTLSRVGFMYGSYGKKIGTIDEAPLFLSGGGLPYPPASYPSLASVFAANGYATGLVGKWHGGVDPNYTGAPGQHPYAQAPITRGYQTWLAGTSGNLADSGGNYFDWTRLDAFSNAPGDYTVTNHYSTYSPQAEVEAVFAWLTATAGNPNRFLHVALNIPHAPFHVPPSEFLNGYIVDSSSARKLYEAMLRATDTTVGYILDLVGTSANVFLWSDNGTPDGAPPSGYDESRLKRSSFDEGTHVLGVYRRTGALAQVNPRLMHAIDIGATLLNSAGIAIPAEWDGRPFGNRNELLTERQDGVEKDRSCRTGCYLYRELTDANSVVTEELYHLPSDPKERTNVVGDPRHAAALTWLRARMADAAL